jgi:hypothetical protein
VASAAKRVRATPRAATHGGDDADEADETAIAMGTPHNLTAATTPAMRMSHQVRKRMAQNRNSENVASAFDLDKRASLPVRSSMRMVSSQS